MNSKKMRYFWISVLGLPLTLVLILLPRIPAESADVRAPISGKLVSSDGNLANTPFEYDNVDCEKIDNEGRPLDVADSGHYGVDTIDSDGSFIINVRPGECFTVSLPDIDGGMPYLIKYNGVLGGLWVIHVMATGGGVLI
jgi:hypothetical protein